MRAALLTCVLLTSVLQLSAQQNSTTRATVSGILDRMDNASRAERERAFGEAGELLQSDAASAKDTDRLQLGIILLLIRENTEDLKAKESPSSNIASEEEQGDRWQKELFGSGTACFQFHPTLLERMNAFSTSD